MHVYKAINAVQVELAKTGITKDRKAQGYNFRGIDDMYNAISPLMGEYGLCILPRVISRESIERQSKSGAAIFYTVVEVEFDFISTEDGSKHVVKTFGEAMDVSDKSTSKAMSSAYKYAVMQAFAIPTEGDNDSENHSHEIIPEANAQSSYGLKPNEVADFLLIINDSQTPENLHSAFTAAYRAAHARKDTAALKTFTEAKDAKKIEMGAV